MTARERKYIEAKAEQFERWYEKEMAKARQSDDQEEKKEHYYQADLNDCAANTLRKLLKELETKDYKDDQV